MLNANLFFWFHGSSSHKWTEKKSPLTGVRRRPCPIFSWVRSTWGFYWAARHLTTSAIEAVVTDFSEKIWPYVCSVYYFHPLTVMDGICDFWFLIRFTSFRKHTVCTAPKNYQKILLWKFYFWVLKVT